MTNNRNRVDWIDPRLSSIYEDMVAVLISRLYPHTQRIDGSGGDNGRDVIMRLPSGTEIFELKSFTGRLSSGRRTQVKNSLIRAAQHNPVAWHLVVPIDPTPGELEWFANLTQEYSFQCDWHGKTWLDDNMAANLDIERYYLGDSNREVVDLLRELHQEQAAFSGGLPDMTERITNLTSRLNELDPHYKFGFSADPDGSITINMLPRYKGAEHDRPIQMGGAFRFPDTAEGREAAQALEDSFNYGIPATIDAEFVERIDLDAPGGIGGSFETGNVRFGLPEGANTEDVELIIRVLGPSGDIRAQVPIRSVTRTAGFRGVEIHLADPTNILHVTLRLDFPSSGLSVHYQYNPPRPALPAIVLPMLRVTAALRAGSQIVLLAKNGVPLGPPIDVGNLDGEAWRHQLHFIEALDEVQRLSGVYFTIPESLTRDELIQVEEARRLLRGQTLTDEWNSLKFTVPVESLDQAHIQAFQATEGQSVLMETEYVLSLGEAHYVLGRVRRICASACAESWPDAPASDDPETMVELTLTPGVNNSVQTQMISLEDTAQSNEIDDL
jgi:hypothetical protein